MNDLRDSRPNNSPAPASILIVDDVSQNIQVLARVLDDGGYLVAAASSGKQALAMIPSVVPDLVLLDVMMPELDGFEVCRRIKASAQTSQIPVILLTARTDPEDILTGMKAGKKNKNNKYPLNSINYLVDANLKEMAKNSKFPL